MLHVAIVDDETVLIERYQKIVETVLAQQGIPFVLHTFSDSLQFREMYRKQPYDLVFLDIDMPNLSGIQLAADLRLLPFKTSLIFVTSHNHFVYESIQYAPFRFIRKDHVEDEMEEAVLAFCKMLENERNHIRLELDNNRSTLVSVSQIMYFYALRHDLFYCDRNKKSFRLAVRNYTMEQLEDMMSPYGFIRIHKSYLLNYNCIYQIQNDHIMLNPDGGESLPLSRRRTAEVREQYRILLREEAIL